MSHKLAIAVAVMHAVVTGIVVVLGAGLVMAGFDDPSWKPGILEEGILYLGQALMLPGSVLWQKGVAEIVGDVGEWILFAGNSYLWGLLVAWSYSRITRTRAPANTT